MPSSVQQCLINGATTLATDAHCRRILRPFVVDLCSGDEPDWSRLRREYGTDFVIRQTTAACAEQGRIVSAVRTSLHFLTADSVVSPQTVRTILGSVAG